MNTSSNYGHKPITLVVITFLVMMLVDGSTTTVTFDASTTLSSSSMKKATIRFLRQSHREKYEIAKRHSFPTTSFKIPSQLYAAAALRQALEMPRGCLTE
ncbi:MAG: hypothetical protein ACRD4W_08555 [Nitrososphaeraceae archaeon]